MQDDESAGEGGARLTAVAALTAEDLVALLGAGEDAGQRPVAGTEHGGGTGLRGCGGVAGQDGGGTSPRASHGGDDDEETDRRKAASLPHGRHCTPDISTEVSVAPTRTYWPNQYSAIMPMP